MLRSVLASKNATPRQGKTAPPLPCRRPRSEGEVDRLPKGGGAGEVKPAILGDTG